MPVNSLVIFFYTMILLSSCSVHKIAVDQMAPVLAKAADQVKTEKSLEFFRQSTPGSLQLAEALALTSTHNEDLLTLLVKGFASYGYFADDTAYLKTKLARSGDTSYKK